MVKKILLNPLKASQLNISGAMLNMLEETLSDPDKQLVVRIPTRHGVITFNKMYSELQKRLEESSTAPLSMMSISRAIGVAHKRIKHAK